MELVDGKTLDFEGTYLPKYKEIISSLYEYQELQRIIENSEYKLLFDYSMEKVYNKIIYSINIGLYNQQNNLVAVPENSKYYDDLGNLIASSNVLFYNPKKNGVKETGLDYEEITEGIKDITNYLRNSMKDLKI